MLLTAAQTLKESISNATSAIEVSDYQKLGEIAHSIKGSLLNLGLSDFSNLAKAIEINAKENPEKDCQALLSQLYENLIDLL